MVSKRSKEPLDLLVLQGRAQVSAYLHPVRHRILQLLGAEAMTGTQVAARLGVHPANLTHHFRALREARLVRLVEKRDVGRVVEKYFRSVARRFEVRVERAADAGGEAAKALGVLAEDLRAAGGLIRDDERAAVVHLAHARLPPELFERFVRELALLVARWRAETDGSESGREYALGLALYPRELARPPAPRRGRKR
jgi:DNA-binding transcriptional ArsR family regulator